MTSISGGFKTGSSQTFTPVCFLHSSWMEKNPEIAVLGRAVRYIDAEGSALGMVRRCSIHYEKRYIYAEDYFLWLRLSKAGKLHALPDVVLDYRIRGEATRVKKIKRVICATLKVKWDAVFKLGIRPTILDVLRFFLEGFRLVMPAGWVLSLYMNVTLGKNRNVVL